uniref:RING-type domain-containing protein n=1 Tax=Arcella intermedia TaxID=1963864 RepID=A0A6B2LKD9_9EUKA
MLFISSRKTAGEWVLPKGFLLSGESARDALQRKTLEEAGLVGAPKAFLGTFPDPTINGNLHAYLFEVREVRTAWAQSFRQRQWVPLVAPNLPVRACLAPVLSAAREDLKASAQPAPQGTPPGAPEAPSHLCCVCMAKDVNTVFLNCAHSSTCQDCAQLLKDCPLCRQPIQSVLKIFKT